MQQYNSTTTSYDWLNYTIQILADILCDSPTARWKPELKTGTHDTFGLGLLGPRKLGAPTRQTDGKQTDKKQIDGQDP